VCAGSTWQAHPCLQWCCAAWQKAFGSMGSSSSSACTVCFGQAADPARVPSGAPFASSRMLAGCAP
jgi:hypothetical protein